MAKREFVQLAHKYDRKKHRIAGWFASEKLDGMRCIWDGGITRGLPASQVPWANTGKHDRYIIPPVATGLWTRYGQPIQAPDWFLNQLPRFPLDGELWLGQGTTVQDVSKVVKPLIPDQRWHDVKYYVFDSPSYKAWLCDGEINNPIWQHRLKGCFEWAIKHCNEAEVSLDVFPYGPRPFETTYKLLIQRLPQTQPNLVLHKQVRLSFTTEQAHTELDALLDQVLANKGEGLVIRNPIFPWAAERAHHILKVKPWEDDEGTVTGYIWGRETDKGSKLLGLMGAMILDYKGKRLELSGFTNEERRMYLRDDWTEDSHTQALAEGALRPGQPVDIQQFTNRMFQIGDKVTFRYRGLTNDGIPKEGRYFRKATEV